LNRALLDLPHCDSITDLALDLGFSSHSHFTSVFRKAFGMTPSQYRAGMPAGSGSAGSLWQHAMNDDVSEALARSFMRVAN
jgi:AraC-like DNA-binding protein